MGGKGADIGVGASERGREAKEHSPLIVFDIMRAAAAVLVLLSHARSLVVTDYAGQTGLVLKLFYVVTGLGHTAVTLFFVISGYWIAGGVIKRVASGRWSWGGYALDRLSRLWIVLIPALLLGLAFDWTGTHLFNLPIYDDGLHGNTPLAGIADHLGIGTFLTNIFFVQTLLGPIFGSNGPLWSLANEFWYYIWFAALYVPFAKPSRIQNWIGVPIVAFTMFKFSALLPGFVSWLMGAGLYLLSRRYQDRPSITSRILWSSSLAILVICLMATRMSHSLGDVGDYLVAGATSFFLFATILARIHPPSQWAPIAQFGALSSYSLYVIHYPFVIFVVGLQYRHARLPPGVASLAFVAAITTAAIALALVFSRLTEWKTTTLRERIERKLAASGLKVRAT